jgi:phosphopentomutase
LNRRAALIVLDGLGIGPAHDQADYGDSGSDTLGHALEWAAAQGEVGWPALEALGLGNCARLAGLPPAATPRAAFGTAQPRSPGKDSTTGHWELCGLVLPAPFPTFPTGFPGELIAEFAARTGRAVVGNLPASGTTIIEAWGDHHRRTGDWIVYTSADSVFQLAAHEEVVPIEELYQACRIARELCVGPWGVSRVIARPFVGGSGAWRRTERRRDYSLEPVGDTLLDHLERAGIPRVGIGKVDDLFAGRGIQSEHTATNARAYRLIGEALATAKHGLILANVIEFDQSWGHRNDVAGFVAGIGELDRAIDGLLAAAQPDDLVIFTADHGNDPTTPSTDHSRERVPILAWGPRVRSADLGERASFADVGQTVAEFLGVGPLAAGRSFLGEIWDD